MPVNTDLAVARRDCSSRLTYGPFNETLMSFENPEEDRSARRSSYFGLRIGSDWKVREGRSLNFIGVSFDLKLRGTFDNMEFGDSLF